MSKNLTINYTNLNIPNMQSIRKAENQITGINNKKDSSAKEEQQGVSVNLSSVGSLKAENNRKQLKKAGETQTRETWENQQYMKNSMRSSATGYFDLIETLRIDEPETYEKYEKIAGYSGELLNKYLGGDESVKEELQKATSERVAMMWDWYERRCMSTGWFQNPVEKEFGSIIALEKSLSDSEHDTSINTYGGNELDDRESMWRFDSKFNILLSKQMLDVVKGLAEFGKKSDEEKKQIASFVDRMEKAVGELRDIEKQYDGNLTYLRFGVKFDEKGDVTYHANYKGCEDKEGIQANTAEDLLNLLKEK